ncbi:MAG: porin family protein [Cruoricaptor ignavus]|nr:porin family protein [Cruoricaptor ignavus]
MKKASLVILLFVGCLASAQKNTKTKAPVKFGIKGGGNYSSISGEDRFRNLSGKFGFHGGLLANYTISKNLHIQGEVLYQNAGTNIKLKNDPNEKGYWQLDYISVPVMFQIDVMPKVFLETGPEVNVNIASAQVMDNSSQYPKTDFKDDTKPVMFSWGVGAGYKLNQNIGVNLRYSLGINSPYKSSTDNYADKFRYGNLQLGLFYMF